MANTDKQNFRYPTEQWRTAVAKLAEMRGHGYDIDMTKALSTTVDQINDETFEQIAQRYGLTRGTGPVPVWRKPFARSEAGQ